jgi:protein-tyrosine phosphatase
LAHPERNTVLARDPERVLEWAQYAPVLQVTGASLAGLFGPSCMRAAWAFLDAPLPCVVATDAHNTGARAPLFGDAFRTIASRRGVVCAEKVCLENPRALILGWRPRAAGGDRPAARREAGYGRTGGVRS